MRMKCPTCGSKDVYCNLPPSMQRRRALRNEPEMVQYICRACGEWWLAPPPRPKQKKTSMP